MSHSFILSTAPQNHILSLQPFSLTYFITKVMWQSDGLKRLLLQTKQQRTSKVDIISEDENQNISKSLFIPGNKNEQSQIKIMWRGLLISLWKQMIYTKQTLEKCRDFRQKGTFTLNIMQSWALAWLPIWRNL